MTKFLRLQGSDYSQYQYIWGRCMQLLLAGDMNSRPTEKPQMELKRHFTALNDTTAYTFPADHPDYCIDYIYGYTANEYDFKVLQQSVLPESVASDHRPVQVDVQVLKK